MTLRPVTRERLGDLTWVLFLIAVLALSMAVPLVALQLFEVPNAVSIPVALFFALIVWGFLSSFLSRDPERTAPERPKRTWAENRRARRSRRLE